MSGEVYRGLLHVKQHDKCDTKEAWRKLVAATDHPSEQTFNHAIIIIITK